MRLLDRYLLRELIIPFSYCLIGFVIFWATFDLFAELSAFQKERLKAGDVLEYYVVTAPSTLVTILPMAFLLALLYALTNHSRHHELTAMRAAGLGLARISLPYFGVGLVLSLAVFAMSELWVPQSNDAAEQIRAKYQAGAVPASGAGPGQRQWETKLGFYNQLERRWWIVEKYHLFSGEMIRARVDWQQADGRRRVILAERGVHTNGVWEFTGVHQFTYSARPGDDPLQEKFESLSMPEFAETPDQIRSEIKINRLGSLRSVKKAQLSLREILEYERLHPRAISPKLQSKLDTKFHGQLAAPWTCLVVVAIALPFGARSGRRNVAVGVASSIFICFAYFVLRELTLALGTGGHAPAWVAAWAPNAAFGLAGWMMAWRSR